MHLLRLIPGKLFASRLLLAAAFCPIPIATALASPGLSQRARTYQFDDIEDHWAIACIEGISTEGLMKGYPTGNFRPNGTMTRAEFAAVMVKAFPNAPKLREATSFVDVTQDFWGAGAIATAYERGFLAGYPGSVFKPNQPISRVQAMVVTAKAQNLSPVENTAAELNRFVDASEIPRYAHDAIASATQRGLIVNYPNKNQLRPNASITRGEATALLCRAGESGTDARYYVPSQYVTGTSTPPPLALLKEFPETFPDQLVQRVVLGDRMFFEGASSDGTAELWATDGTSTGTQPVRKLAIEQDDGRVLRATYMEIPKAVGDRLWIQTGATFRRDDAPDSLQTGIWSSDGTAAGTRAIASFSPELRQVLITAEYWLSIRDDIGGQHLFIVNTPESAQLWLTDGTSTAQQFANFPHAYDNGGQRLGFVPQKFASIENDSIESAAGNYLLFTASTGNGTDLWRTDRTAEGTVPFKNFTEAAFSFQFWKSAKDRAYFTVTTPELGEELWVTSGTEESTTVLKDIYPGPEGSDATIITNIGETRFFMANSDKGMELWATEGTTATTKLVKRLSTEIEFDRNLIYTTYENKLFFVTPTAETSELTAVPRAEPFFDLWVTDGTESGTQRLGLVISNYFADFTPYKGRLFFNGYGVDGQELWVTDGSAEGTYQVIDLNPGADVHSPNCPAQVPLVSGSASGQQAQQIEPAEHCIFNKVARDAMPRSLTVLNGYLYFIANNGELFRTDGTGRGVQSIGVGGDGCAFCSPEITQLGQRLLVTGYNQEKRRSQLWVFPQ